MSFIIKNLATVAALCASAGMAQYNSGGGGGGSAAATWENYESFAGLTGSPPGCGMDYSALDVNKIVAYGDASYSLCGACVKLTGTQGSVTAMIVDNKAAGGFDISGPLIDQLYGSKDAGNWQVQWQQVDISQCSGIWNGKMSTAQSTFKGLEAQWPNAQLTYPSLNAAGQDAQTATQQAKGGQGTASRRAVRARVVNANKWQA